MPTTEPRGNSIDYVSILTRAVEALDPNNRETRAAVYQRARSTVSSRLRLDGVLPTDVRAQLATLEAAIARVENDSNRPSSQSTGLQEGYEDMADTPALKQPWRPRRVVASLIAMLVIASGIAVYLSWPRIVAQVQSSLRPARHEVVLAANGRAVAAYVRLRQIVYYRSNQPVGTIVVDKSQPFLYVVRPNVSALRYSVDLSDDCGQLAGLFHVSRKQDPPAVLYLNDDHRIQGFDITGEGRASSESTCIRLTNDDVDYLYQRTPLDNRVVISN